MPGPSYGELPESLLAEARLEMERFFDRWPTSPYLRRLRPRTWRSLLPQT